MITNEYGIKIKLVKPFKYSWEKKMYVISFFPLLFSCNLSDCIREAMYPKRRSSTVWYRSSGCCPNREVLWQIDGRRRKLKQFPSKQTNATSLEVNIVYIIIRDKQYTGLCIFLTDMTVKFSPWNNTQTNMSVCFPNWTERKRFKKKFPRTVTLMEIANR